MNKEITITYPIGEETAYKLSEFFNAELDDRYGEFNVVLDNGFGNGVIRVLPCGAGICLLSFDVNFLVDVTFKIEYSEIIPIDFMFLSSGQLSIKLVGSDKSFIERYQNVIVRYKLNEPVSYKIDTGEVFRLNIIQVRPKPYLEKNSHFLELEELNIKEMFHSEDNTRFYRHFGNFNLKIADYIRQLNHCAYNGMIRSLMLEGYVNIILGLQLVEYENFIENRMLPDSLSKKDIIKIEKAAAIIQEKINQNLSVSQLASMVRLPEPKLQLGFKYLFHQTVNGYAKEIKLQTAHDYFLNSNLNISEVVYEVGYSSRSYFTKIFFERFGILPNKFKNHSK